MNNEPRKLAEALSQKLEEASALCNESLAVVRQHEGLGELNVYARLVGLFLGQSYTNILAPLWERFPEIEPDQMKGEYAERLPTLSPESRKAISSFLSAVKPALELAQHYAAASERLPFGGVTEVVESVEEIERFLVSPRFRDDAADVA